MCRLRLALLCSLQIDWTGEWRQSRQDTERNRCARAAAQAEQQHRWKRSKVLASSKTCVTHIQWSPDAESRYLRSCGTLLPRDVQCSTKDGQLKSWLFQYSLRRTESIESRGWCAREHLGNSQWSSQLISFFGNLVGFAVECHLQSSWQHLSCRLGHKKQRRLHLRHRQMSAEGIVRRGAKSRYRRKMANLRYLVHYGECFEQYRRQHRFDESRNVLLLEA